jgi:glycosyltransferase involved in cell wall biosynthesis
MVVHSPVPSDVRVMAQASAAAGGGFEVDIVAMRATGEAAEELLEQQVRAIRLPVKHAYGSGLPAAVGEYLAFAALALVRVGALHRRRSYDVVQVHNPPDFLMVAALLPRLRGAKTIFDVHDLAPDLFHSRFAGRRGAGIADRMLAGVERAATRTADYVLTVHEPYRRELISRGVPAEKITVVMNTVDERLLPVPAHESPDGFRVVYHGTITPHYGVELMVGAAAAARASLPDLRLEVYGDGDSVDGVVRRAAAAGLGDRFLHLAELPRAEVLRRINGASVGVVPNLPTRLNRFALSTKLFEYVALGIPAVVADLPTLRAHFSPEEVLFFRAGDEDALARAIVQVADDPVAARARAAAARRRYEDYRWEQNAERYLSVLREAARVAPADRS